MRVLKIRFSGFNKNTIGRQLREFVQMRAFALCLSLTAGAGTKFAFTDAISGFVEYRFTNCGTKSHPAIPVGMGVIAAHTLDLHTHQVQAGFSISLDALLAGGG